MTDPRDPVKVLLEAADDATPGEPRRLARALRILVEAYAAVIGNHAHNCTCPAHRSLLAAAREVTHE